MVRMRKTKGKRNSGRAHHGVTVPAYTEKKQEGEEKEVVQRHRASRVTGTYRDRSVIDVSRNIARKEKRLERKTPEQGDDENRTVEQAKIPNTQQVRKTGE